MSEHICDIWGHRGELWTPSSRILDVSNAGFEVLTTFPPHPEPKTSCFRKLGRFAQAPALVQMTGCHHRACQTLSVSWSWVLA